VLVSRFSSSQCTRPYSTPSSRSSLATVTVVLVLPVQRYSTCAGIFAPALAGMLRPIYSQYPALPTPERRKKKRPTLQTSPNDVALIAIRVTRSTLSVRKYFRSACPVEEVHMRTLSMMGHVFLKGQACAEQRLRGKHEMDTDSINLYPL
jgi:hypothetical protein